MISTAKLGDYFLWDGQLVQCKWIIERGNKVIGFTKVEPCPHCGKDIEHAMNVIESSPQFQEMAKPIETIFSNKEAEFIETPIEIRL